jgi:hypothetical protein
MKLVFAAMPLASSYRERLSPPLKAAVMILASLRSQGRVTYAVRLMQQPSALTMPVHKDVVGQARPHCFCRSMASSMDEL